LTDDLLQQWTTIALEVLSEDDPRFNIPAEERYLAGIRKIMPKSSPTLREGIAETIALLGTRGDKTPQGAPEGASWRATVLVRQLLEHPTPIRWFSLSYILPLLAEADPDEFLSALESDLQSSAPTVISLFEKNADGIFSSSPHTSLMWALQNLGWEVAQLSRVTLVLATLMKLDTGGRISPRPTGVLHDIFRFWFPQTSATVGERLQALELLSTREPDVAFTVLLALLPQTHEWATHSSKPRWRDYDTSQIKQITQNDIDGQVSWAGDRLTTIASGDTSKWDSLLKEFARLPERVQQATLKWLEGLDPANLEPDKRITVWKRVRHLVREHRFFHEAFWALPKQKVDELANLELRLAPNDPVERSRWIFGNGAFRAFGDTKTPFEEQERLREEAQCEAIQEIVKAKGIAGALDLASTTSFPHTIGILIAKMGLIQSWEELLPDKLSPTNRSARDVAAGYVGARVGAEGYSFVESLPLEQWPFDVVAELALSLNFEKEAWQMLRRRKPEAEPYYWKGANPIIRGLSDEDLEDAIKCFLQHRRPIAAIGALSSAIHHKAKPPSGILADVLESASLEPDPAAEDILLGEHSIWQLCELMKRIQNDAGFDQNRLAKLEWRFLPLARFHDFVPKTLHKELSQNSAFFAEVIAAQFRAKGEVREEGKTTDPTIQTRAEAAHDLLDSWIGIPGARPDGSIDPSSLRAWISNARKLCQDNGRIAVCDLMIGEQLSCAPPDPDGTWPCEPVRDILETVPTDEILRGLDCGVCNQRGTYSKAMTEGGEQERALAKKYHALAEKCKLRWPRTALALRRLAQTYESGARREDERAEGRN
jgi:hypothetical protein